MEIEKRIIGALMTIGNEKDVRVQEAILKLERSYFMDFSCREIFKLIVKRIQLHEPFDAFSMMELIDRQDYQTYCQCCELDHSKSHYIDDDVNALIKEYFNQKRLSVTDSYVKKALASRMPSERDELLTELTLKLSNMLSISQDDFLDYDKSTPLLEEDRPQFLKTGFRFMPEIQNKSMITICGRPGVGKTNFAIYLMDRLLANNTNKRGLVFSIEMEKSIIQMRHQTMGMDNECFVRVIRTPKEITIEEIEMRSKLESKIGHLGVIVVDYLGLIQARKEKEAHYLTQMDICRRLAALSIDLNVVVIALSQVNRDAKIRKDKCPIPTDAADSSGSERSSSLWLGIDRQVENLFEVKCRKNRNGNCFEGQFGFDGFRFVEKWETVNHEYEEARYK